MAEARKPGWWYPYIFVFGFVVVIGVNGALAYFATTSFTGLATEQAYDKGLAYNQNLDMAKAQAEMGWSVVTTVEPVAGASSPRATITIAYADRDGRPVDGLEVRAQMVRPTTNGHDHGIALPAQGQGIYGTTIDLPLAGVWDMDIAAYRKDVSYQHAKRFVIP